MSQQRPSAARVFSGHLVTGLVIGVIFGSFYFLLEPVRDFSRHYVYLGAPLSRLFVIYAVFGVTLGATLGALAGFVAVFSGRLSKPHSAVAFHVAALATLLTIMLVFRHENLAGLRAQIVSLTMVGLGFAGLVWAAVGFVLSRVLEKRSSFRSWRASRSTVAALATVLLVTAMHFVAVAAEGRLPGGKSPAVSAPNFVVIVLDALRADHLSSYGYHRQTSPNMDRLADEGVLFLNAHSHGNRTIIAMPSVFTSLYPSFHGAIGRREFKRALPESRTTVTEVLEKGGYTSVGVMTNIYLKNVFGLTQGFDRVEEFYTARYELGLFRRLRRLGILDKPKHAETSIPDADVVTDESMRWLARLADRPFFLYIHYMDTHHPYTPPRPFDTHFSSEGSLGDAGRLFHKTAELVREDPPLDLPVEELARLKDYYDGTIRFADREIGRLIDRIRSLPGDPETIVLITSDHGDEFLEHGSLYHTNLLIEELIHVPLIVWSSKGSVGREPVEELVRHIDIMPTLIDMAGLDIPETVSGQSLVPLMRGETSDYDVVSIAEGDFCTSLNYKNWKIMHVDSTESYHLFDLARDPREQEDVSALHPDVMADLKARLDEYLRSVAAIDDQTAETADDETIRQLRALGYFR